MTAKPPRIRWKVTPRSGFFDCPAIAYTSRVPANHRHGAGEQRQRRGGTHGHDPQQEKHSEVHGSASAPGTGNQSCSRRHVAPSAGNEQPWEFVVITDRVVMQAITKVHPYSQMLKEGTSGYRRMREPEREIVSRLLGRGLLGRNREYPSRGRRHRPRGCLAGRLPTRGEGQGNHRIARTAILRCPAVTSCARLSCREEAARRAF